MSDSFFYDPAGHRKPINFNDASLAINAFYIVNSIHDITYLYGSLPESRLRKLDTGDRPSSASPGVQLESRTLNPSELDALPEGVDLSNDTGKTLYVVKDGKCVEKVEGEEEAEDYNGDATEEGGEQQYKDEDEGESDYYDEDDGDPYGYAEGGYSSDYEDDPDGANYAGLDAYQLPGYSQGTAYRKLGPRLVGLEIGNERQDSGTPGQFTSKFLDAAYRIGEEVFRDRYKQIYTAGTLHAPTLIQCEDEEDKENCWSVRSLFENGMNEKGVIKVADTHQYKRLYETLTRSITRQYLLNHTSTAWFVNSHDSLAAFTTAQGIPYVLGETNSLFGHGRRNVSDTFAAALWTIDYTLYSAQTNITNLGFHQSWGVGVWIVEFGFALNLADWHSAGKEDERTKVTIQLENLRPRGWKGEVYRLTAPGADVKDPDVISFAGQYVDDVEGAVHGRVDIETLGRDRKLTLKASEAAVVMFDY
ncbi:hypothetical protein BJX65DRAFT_314710 [Aspergillus insuetus]